MTSTISSFVNSSKGRPISPEGGKTRLFTGSPHPFGATVDDEGVNFAVYSANATAIQLLLFDNPSDLEPSQVIDLSAITNKSFYIWHVYVQGLKPGCGYAYRMNLGTATASTPQKFLLTPIPRVTHCLFGKGAQPVEVMIISTRACVVLS